MKMPQYTRKYKRVIIILMIINAFALMVNTQTKNPSITYEKRQGYEKRIYLLTDSKNYTENYFIYNNLDGKTAMRKRFWPFIDFFFIGDDSGLGASSKHRNRTSFRGLFADFDLSEFLIYSLIIFGFPYIKRIWTDKSDVANKT